MLKELTCEQQHTVEKLLQTMTLDEKIGQLLCERFSAIVKHGDPIAYLKRYPLGSIYVGAEVIDTKNMDGAALCREADAIQSVTRVPVALVSDFEQGVGGQLEQSDFTAFPEAMALSACGDPQAAYRMGEVTAREAASLNVHWTLGTVLDPAIERHNPITGIRSYGCTPEQIIPFIRANIRGLQEHNCAACAKHFPGDGLDTRNQHLVTSINPLNEEEWEALYGKIWRAAIEEGVMSIMVGHIAMPQLEPMDAKSGKYRPATVSKCIITGLLREKLGFKGLVMSDALCMTGFYSWADYETRILDAFNAGIDVFEWTPAESFFKVISAALADGRASMDRLNDAVRHILEFKMRLNLVKMPCVPDPADSMAAKTMARNALNLLRNQNRSLPLPQKEDAGYLVIATPPHPALLPSLEPFISELRKYGKVETQLLDQLHFDHVEKFDAVLFVNVGRMRFGDYRGMHGNFWGVMADDSIQKRIGISFANPFFLYDIPSCDAYINTYSPHPESQRAVVEALFGKIECNGHSPIEIPFYVRQGDALLLHNNTAGAEQ